MYTSRHHHGWGLGPNGRVPDIHESYFPLSHGIFDGLWRCTWRLLTTDQMGHGDRSVLCERPDGGETDESLVVKRSGESSAPEGSSTERTVEWPTANHPQLQPGAFPWSDMAKTSRRRTRTLRRMLPIKCGRMIVLSSLSYGSRETDTVSARTRSVVLRRKLTAYK